MRVGFIGLGLMGSGMTNNLQKAGHQLVLHDLRREAAEKLIAGGAEWANSPRDVASSAEVVFTSLPGFAGVRGGGGRQERPDRGHAAAWPGAVRRLLRDQLADGDPPPQQGVRRQGRAPARQPR